MHCPPRAITPGPINRRLRRRAQELLLQPVHTFVQTVLQYASAHTRVGSSRRHHLGGEPSSPIDVIRTRLLNYNGFTYTSSVVPASAASPALPPVVLLPPIGVGIDRTFCGRLLEAWAVASPSATLHAIDVIGMGDSSPKPRMKRRLLGGWEEPPRTPREWAEQVVAYITEEVGEPCVVVGQSNLCTVALEAAALDPEAVKGIERLSPLWPCRTYTHLASPLPHIHTPRLSPLLPSAV